MNAQLCPKGAKVRKFCTAPVCVECIDVHRMAELHVMFRWVYGRSPRGSNSGLSGSRSYRRNSRPLSASSTGSQGLSASGDLGAFSAMESSRSGDSFTGLNAIAASRPSSGFDQKRRSANLGV